MGRGRWGGRGNNKSSSWIKTSTWFKVHRKNLPDLHGCMVYTELPLKWQQFDMALPPLWWIFRMNCVKLQSHSQRPVLLERSGSVIFWKQGIALYLPL